MQRECEQTQAKMHDQRQAALSSNIITALTPLRTNLSPFTKGCREWDASVRLSIFAELYAPTVA